MKLLLKVPLVSRVFSNLCLLAAIFGLTGCTHGVSDLKTWVAQQKQHEKVPILALPVIKTFETFSYHDQALRDPFSSSPSEIQANKTSSLGPGAHHVRQPLEMFALDSLKMVGTLGQGRSLQALIESPDSVIHRVVVDSYMGQHYGRVINVQPDHVDLIELIPNGSAGWIKRPASIALGEQQDDDKG